MTKKKAAPLKDVMAGIDAWQSEHLNPGFKPRLELDLIEEQIESGEEILVDRPQNYYDSDGKQVRNAADGAPGIKLGGRVYFAGEVVEGVDPNLANIKRLLKSRVLTSRSAFGSRLSHSAKDYQENEIQPALAAINTAKATIQDGELTLAASMVAVKDSERLITRGNGLLRKATEHLALVAEAAPR